MATHTVANPADIAGAEIDRINFEDAGYSIDGLLALVSWVERARNLIMDVEQGVAINPDFAAAARDLDLRWADGSWGGDESAGLRYLLAIVQLKCRDSHAAGFQLERIMRDVREVAHV